MLPSRPPLTITLVSRHLLSSPERGQYGGALLNCSGACGCAPTWLDARASKKDRHRVSLHSIENVVLSTSAQQQQQQQQQQQLTGSGGEGPAPGCCVVTIETFLASALPSPAVGLAKGSKASSKLSGKRAARRDAASAQGAATGGGGGGGGAVQVVGAPMKFKVLSFFVGPTAAGKGRLHQQSIVISEDAGLDQ